MDGVRLNTTDDDNTIRTGAVDILFGLANK